MPDLETGVVVIGGGATGAGVLRDLALRGIDALLVEKGDLASGTTGRSHGLLHSGARYCVEDEPAATECREEGGVLRRIAPFLIEDTGGTFVTLTEADLEWQPRFVAGCRRTRISCERISVEEARRREPALAKEIRSAFWIRGEGHPDPFGLVLANAAAAQRLGARVMTYSEVIGFLRRGDAVSGVRTRDVLTGEVAAIGCQAVINAAGPWAGVVARRLGIDLRMSPVKGVMVIFAQPLVSTAVHRCHPPGEGDILAPAAGVAILGTTASAVQQPDPGSITWPEVSRLLEGGEKLVEGIRTAPVLRAYAGVRPLYDPGAAAGGPLSRSFAVIDHGVRDGVSGFASIVGGKVTTYRLMAERVVDLVAGQFGVGSTCTTADTPLVDPKPARAIRGTSPPVPGALDVGGSAPPLPPLLCECELVRPEDVATWLKNPVVRNLDDLRRRTRVGTGPCQGAFCGLRLAAELVDHRGQDGTTASVALAEFLEARWRGTRPVFWGSRVRQAQIHRGLHLELFNLDRLVRPSRPSEVA